MNSGEPGNNGIEDQGLETHKESDLPAEQFLSRAVQWKGERDCTGWRVQDWLV